MNDVESYAAEVRAALADLPPRLRDDLLEDLPAHLSEVAAESDEPLHGRLGPPQAYAAELRTTVEIGQSAPRLPFRARLAAVRARLRVADTKLGPLIGYAKVSDFVPLLRPGWWLLRGYVAAMVMVDALDLSESSGLLPRIGGNALVGLVVLVGFMVGSVWLGRRQHRFTRWPRRALLAGSALLVLAALVGFADVDDTLRGPAYYEVVDHDPYGDVGDVYVYDQNGQLLRGVRVYDQEGNPIVFNTGVGCDTAAEPGNIYPRCPDQAPFLVRK